MNTITKDKLFKIISLMVYVTLITFLAIGKRDLFFGDEVRYADVYMRLKDGNFITLTLNGVPYPDKPPFFFIFIYILELITGIGSPNILFLSTAITALIFILSSFYFINYFSEDYDTAFYSNLLITSNLYFIALANFVKMDMLFSSFILISFIFFHKYYAENSYKYLYLAFFLAGIALMVKGLLGLIFPLISFITFIIIKKRFNLILTIHFFLALLISLLPTIIWIYLLIQYNGFDYVYNSIFYQQTIRRAVDAFHSKKPFYFYLIILPLIWMPISLILFLRLKNLKNDILDFTRTNDKYLYTFIVFIVSFIILSLISSKFPNYLLPIFPSFAMFLYFLLKRMNNKIIWYLISLIYLIITIALYILPYIEKISPFLKDVRNYQIIPLVSLIISITLTSYPYKNDIKKSIKIYCIMILLFANSLNLIIVPQISHNFSPKILGEALKGYAEIGFTPISFNTYHGTFSFYAKRTVLEVRDFEELTNISKNKKVVIAISEKNWNKWKDKPSNLIIKKKVWLNNKFYLLIVTAD